MIVGGINSWVNQLKQLFPDWKYINPRNFTADKTKTLEGADGLFIYSGYADHMTVLKYKNQAIDQGIPYGFINHTNKGKLLKEITDHLKSWENTALAQ